MVTRATVLTLSATLAGAAVAWLVLSAGSPPAGEGRAAATPVERAAPNPPPPARAAGPSLTEAATSPRAGTNTGAEGPPANAGKGPAAATAGPATTMPTPGGATAGAAEAAAASTPSPEQKAAAQALLLAGLNVTPALATAQPAPVDLRRNHRLQAAVAPPVPEAVSAADTGLRSFPGAVALPGQSHRSGNTVSATSHVMARFKDVRSHFAAQLQPSADGVRQLTVLTDNDEVFDARVVDLATRTIHRAQLAAGDNGVTVQVSRIDVR